MRNSIVNTKIIDYIFYFAIFIDIMWGANAWFLWNLFGDSVKSTMFNVAICIISLLYMKIKRISFNFSIPLLFAVIVYFFATIIEHQKISFGVLFLITTKLVLYFVLYSLKTSDKMISFLAKTLAIILIPSILVHIYLFFFDLPFIITCHPSQDNYIFFNYLFALRGADYGYNDIRFLSYFLEAGYAGTLFSFFLFLTKFDFSKWFVKVIFVSLLLTLSLAGFAIAFLGYLFVLIIEKKKVYSIVRYGIIVVVTYLFFTNYDNGNNPINERLLSRLETDSEKTIKGNNRVSGATDFYFNKLLNEGNLLFGLGYSNVVKINGSGKTYRTSNFENEIRGAGLIRYIVTYGLLCYILYIAFYILIAFESIKKGNKYAIAFLLLIILTTYSLTLLTNPYWTIPFILCLKSPIRCFKKQHIHYY